MAKKNQKSSSVSEFHTKDIIALSLSALAVILAGTQVYLAFKNEKQNSKF